MWVSVSLALSLASLTAAWPHRKASSNWPGWKGIKYMFIFGDSYTQSGFDVNGTQPNAANPMGNPAYPGWTSSNGPNWVDFLTYTYNASYLQTYNIAYGGATVDSALVTPYAPTVLSMKNQVADEFLPNYTPGPSSKSPWEKENTLFSFFIGINDVGNSWWLNNATLTDLIFAEYEELLEKVYKTGARNFLFLSVPPVNLAPLTLQNGDYAIENEGAAIENWNARLVNLTSSFNSTHEGTTTFVHDTHGTFSAALQNPAVFPQTAGIKNTTTWCKAYENGTPSWYTFNETCGIPVNEYFWLNDLHPTFPIHNATADSIVQYLNSFQ